MGCGCRKGKYPTANLKSTVNNNTAAKSFKDRLMKASAKNLLDLEQKKLSICDQCNHKIIFQDIPTCSKTNKKISDISKDKNFSCPLNKFI